MRPRKQKIISFLMIMMMIGGMTFPAVGWADTMSFMHTIPVVMITADENDLWDENTGMLAEGPNINKSSLPFRNAVYREYGLQERLGHITLTMPDGMVMIDQDMTIQLYSLYMGVEAELPQKPLEIHALPGEVFSGKLFDQSEQTSFTGLVLSNSGSDSVDTNLRDVYISALLDAYNSTILHQHFQPVAVYLNGTYWGMYALGEAMDANWISYYTGIDPEEAALLRASGHLEYGKSSEYQSYRDVMNNIRKYQASVSAENLEYLMEHIDVDAYLEYIAVLMFLGDSEAYSICVVNSSDGRWRLVWQDNDFCMFQSSFDSVKSYTKAEGMGIQHVDNTILRELLKIDEYRDLFFKKLGRVYQFLTPDRMIEILAPIVQLVQGEMMLHCVRWCHEGYEGFIYDVSKDDAYGGYQWWLTRIERLHNTCRRRPAFMWNYIQEGFGLSDEEMVTYFGIAPASWQDIIADKS